MRLSCSLKESTWSMNGLLLGWFLGVLKIYTIISFISLRWVDWSKPSSKDKRGLLNLRQLPVSFSSSVVWMLLIWNLIEGPAGLFDSHMKKSFCLRCSKYMQLLHDFSKHISSITSRASLRFNFDSILVFGIRSHKSFTRWRIRPAIPREHTTRVLCRFFHSFEAGSGSLNALKSSSGSKLTTSDAALVPSSLSSSLSTSFASPFVSSSS